MYLDDLDRTHDCNEYKLLMGLLEQQPSEDCIARQPLIDNWNSYADMLVGESDSEIVMEWIFDAPSVTPTFPKGTTNGDMIKTMFPDIKIHEHKKTDICDAYIQIDIWDFSIYVSKDWWNAPYKKGNKND